MKKEGIIRREHRIIGCFELVELASVVTQIIMEYGSICEHIEIDAGSITFKTVEIYVKEDRK